MNEPHAAQSSVPSAPSPADAKVAAELDDGISVGLSPQPDRDDADGETVTRLSSWWNHLQCRRCGHTFRRGDPVRVDQATRSVVHLVVGLMCGLTSDAADDAEEIAGFREGLMSTWPLPAGPRIRRLAPDDWRIPEGPGDLREANVCLHCGHTFRLGEYVVVCPCQPELPLVDGTPRAAACGRAVHRDPAAGLCCWESWRPDGVVPVCPVTQTRVDGA